MNQKKSLEPRLQAIYRLGKVILDGLVHYVRAFFFQTAITSCGDQRWRNRLLIKFNSSQCDVVGVIFVFENERQLRAQRITVINIVREGAGVLNGA